MNYYNFQIVLQEVPGEISLCFSISGCSLKCEGCHSSFLWKKENGTILSKNIYQSYLNQYKNLASCVLFMGGEWHEKEIVSYLKLANKMNYKTCLYTGEDAVSVHIMNELNWIKTGKWKSTLGGLTCSKTNQKFIDIKTNTILNELFTKAKTHD